MEINLLVPGTLLFVENNGNNFPLSYNIGDSSSCVLRSYDDLVL